MITGLDLVEWQLRVAAGEPLPLGQEQVSINGHAIEARIYAEDPARGFVPSIGRLLHLREPTASAHVRVDTGVREGDEIGVHYDPMIAKLVCWDTDRGAALRQLRQALAGYRVAGLASNLEFLAALTAHRAFALAHQEPGLLDTGLIERYGAELFPAREPVPGAVLAVAVLARLRHAQHQALERAARGSDRHSPWNATDGWRLNEDNFHVFRFLDGERMVAVTAHYREAGYVLDLPGGPVHASATEGPDGGLVVDLDGARCHAHVVWRTDSLTVFAFGRAHSLGLEAARSVDDDDGGGSLAAPMPGTVVEVLVPPGTVVEKGAALLILEAMKMEHTIRAPAAGTVKAVFYAKGDQVAESANLIEFEPAP
jgi:3-methylcrotonyl-CoA carboxylase alpha subunit